ncbi:hypothetical protein HK096_006574 [Nowakowskiella sp. JEL0078]|nr:hypothetical protein HK096_006574 [Nowakowskiella sp. JEL0078]
MPVEVENIPLPRPLPEPASLSKAPGLPMNIPLEDPLQIAIWYHEQNCLDVATYYFSHSAAQGNSIGLLLYAVSLRHGWGASKKPEESMLLLQKAAQMAGAEFSNLRKSGGGHEDFGNGYSGTIKKIQTDELILALAEISMSFRMGWGVQKNLTTSIYYLELAAQLGDPDSQFEMGELFMRGDGVKKSKHEAAQWYRKAEARGKKGVSMQWIWKKKYDDPRTSSDSLNEDHDEE